MIVSHGKHYSKSLNVRRFLIARWYFLMNMKSEVTIFGQLKVHFFIIRILKKVGNPLEKIPPFMIFNVGR